MANLPILGPSAETVPYSRRRAGDLAGGKEIETKNTGLSVPHVRCHVGNCWRTALVAAPFPVAHRCSIAMPYSYRSTSTGDPGGSPRRDTAKPNLLPMLM